MTEYLFLYTKPFLVVDTEKNRNKYNLDFFGETDRIDEEKIRALIFKFAVEEKLVLVIQEKVFLSTDEDTGSWVWLINWMNFRGLIDMQNYGKLMAALQSATGYPLGQIIDLHIRLGSLFDERILNTIANRTMSSVMLIPYEVPKNSESTEWSKIHGETPFIWLIIFIQIIIRSMAIKPA